MADWGEREAGQICCWEAIRSRFNSSVTIALVGWIAKPCSTLFSGVNFLAMMLRIKIPQQLFLCGRSEDQLETASVSFFYNRYAITLSLEGGEVKKATWNKPDDYTQWYRESTHAELVIADEAKSDRAITDLIAPSRHEDLLDLIEGAVLKAIRVIRNVGFVPELPESLPRNEPLEEILRSWKPEISSDGATWTTGLPHDSERGYRSLLGIFGRSGFASDFARMPELKIIYWARIKEVLEDNLEIAPQDEFLTNTIGHLRACNFRLALIDAVIGLEIVLTRYLRCYLATIKKMPKKRIDSFLLNDFGLTPRLAGILDLTMHESYLRDIKLDQVLKAVTWRNHIVHKTGQLPIDVTVETLREHIDAVLDLARTLAKLYVDTAAFSDRQVIGKKLKTNWSERIGWPILWIKPWHQVYAEVSSGIGVQLSKEEMRAIAEELGGYLKARDRRFNPTSDLQVNYKKYMGESIGKYYLGSVILEGELSVRPVPSVSSGSGNSTSSLSGAGSTEVSVT